MAQTQSAGVVSGSVRPGPSAASPPGPPGRTGRTRGRWESLATPSRLWVGLLCSALVILLLTAAAALTIQNEQTSARGTSGVIEQRAVNIQELYYSLADADAAAATGILDNPAPPARFTQRYQTDLNQADDSLAEASVDVAGDPAAFAQLELVDAQLSQYTGLIGTAQADNRIGFPVGGAYLRAASKLLEGSMLHEVLNVQKAEISARSASASDSGGLPVWTLAAAVLAALGCVWTWRLLARSTRRRINLGLAAAMLLGVAILGWTLVASLGAHSGTTTASADFQQVSQAQEAHSDLAEISADEAGSVVSQGADLGTAATAGQAALTDLQKDPAVQGSTVVPAISGDVLTIQKDAGIGAYFDATQVMVGTGTGTTAAGAPVPLDTLATALAGTLATTVQQDQAQYQADSSAVVGDYPGGPWPILLLGLLAAAAAVTGINRRIAEYR